MLRSYLRDELHASRSSDSDEVSGSELQARIAEVQALKERIDIQDEENDELNDQLEEVLLVKEELDMRCLASNEEVQSLKDWRAVEAVRGHGSELQKLQKLLEVKASDLQALYERLESARDLQAELEDALYTKILGRRETSGLRSRP